MRSLDTNIVLRLLLKDVSHQYTQVIALLDASRDNSLSIADAVFFECVWILSGSYYAFERELIGKLVLQITEIPQINCNQVMLQRAVPLYVAHPAISFIDAYLSVYAELNNAVPLLTFDKKLATQLPQAAELLT